MKYFIWILAQTTKPETQCISNWTGFNIQICDGVKVIQDSVSYLPNHYPAPEMSTVMEVKHQIISIISTLQLNMIVCVFNEAM